MNSLQFESFRKTKNFDADNYEFGFNSENILFQKLKSYFDLDLEQLPEGDAFDFYSKKTQAFFELKTRRCQKDQYIDTTISKHKIDSTIKNNGHEYYFLFKFTDGLFYWRYDAMVYLREYYIHGVNHVFIPMNSLVEIV